MTTNATSSAPRPNIILLMTDQQRSDHVGWAADSRMATPNLDRLAATGTAFTRAITTNPICTPARSCLMTGKYSHQIGMVAMSGDLSLQHPTYARALQRAGYWTAGVGKFHLLQGWPWKTPRGKGHPLTEMRDSMRQFGFDHLWEAAGKQLAMKNYCDYAAHLDSRGMLEAYRDHIDRSGPNTPQASKTQFDGSPWPLAEEDYVDNVIGDRVLDAIDQRPGDRPFYLFASFCGPHKPYDPPRSWLERFELEEVDDFLPGEFPLDAATKARLYKLRRAYKAMIALIDYQVGRIIERLDQAGLRDNTVILFTCDHGEMLGDRGRLSKQAPWRQSVQIPTMIHDPRTPTKRVCDRPIEITDLTATILDLAGLDSRKALSKPWPAFHDRVPCRSLLPVVRGEVQGVRDWAFAECNGLWQMMESASFKYIRWIGLADGKSTESLYHIESDPGEQIDLAKDPAYRGTLEEARTALTTLLNYTQPAQLSWAPTMNGDS